MAFCHNASEDYGPSPSPRFQPSERYFDDIHPTELEIPSKPPNFTHPACSHVTRCKYCENLQPHKNSIVVAFDGTCRGNGQANANVNTRSAIGVYFSKDSKYNIGRMMGTDVQTNQVAELYAGIEALRMVAGFVQGMDERVQDLPLEQVVVKSDLEYLVKGMTVWVIKLGEWVEDCEGKAGGE